MSAWNGVCSVRKRRWIPRPSGPFNGAKVDALRKAAGRAKLGSLTPCDRRDGQFGRRQDGGCEAAADRAAGRKLRFPVVVRRVRRVGNAKRVAEDVELRCRHRGRSPGRQNGLDEQHAAEHGCQNSCPVSIRPTHPRNIPSQSVYHDPRRGVRRCVASFRQAAGRSYGVGMAPLSRRVAKGKLEALGADAKILRKEHAD